MKNVDVNPELFRWAIIRSGLPEDKLYSKFPKIDDWISQKRKPTFRQLEEFARTTMTPFGAMFLDEPPEVKLPITDFRTKSDFEIDQPSPNLIDTIQAMQLRQLWMKEWRLEQRSEKLPFVGSVTPSTNIKSVAQGIRKMLELSPDWTQRLEGWRVALSELRQAVERAGILVFSNSVVGLNNFRPLDPDEFRGFVLCDDLAPLIFLNDADSLSARIFTLAHELAHIWIGTSGLFNLIQTMPSTEGNEKFCNAVAAEFLVPEYQFRSEWGELPSTRKAFIALAKHFKVSPLVIARRALDLGLINTPEFFAYHKKTQKNWEEFRAKLKEKSGGNFYATQSARLGRSFSAAIVRAAKEGRILRRDAYRLTGMKGETFDKYSSLILQRMKDERE
jgi:Zn-dependent peptidase ImmA (M78 family)